MPPAPVAVPDQAAHSPLPLSKFRTWRPAIPPTWGNRARPGRLFGSPARAVDEPVGWNVLPVRGRSEYSLGRRRLSPAAAALHFAATVEEDGMPCSHLSPRHNSQPVEARKDHLLDLACPRIDLARNRVPQLTLDLVISHVAIAAVDLDRVQATLDAGLAHIGFGDGSFPQGVLPLLLEPARFVEDQARGLKADIHFGNLAGNGRELANRLAELLTVGSVLQGGLQQPPHHPQMAGENANALPLHRAGKDRLAEALAAQHVLRRDLAILKHQLGHGGRAQSHLVQLLADGEARRSPVDDESGNAGRALGGINIGKHDYDIGDRRIRNESLGAVDDITIALAYGA